MSDVDLLDKRINFVIHMVTICKVLELPREWWYTSYKKDSYIQVVDSLIQNLSDIRAALKKHNITFKSPKKKDKTVVFVLEKN